MEEAPAEAEELLGQSAVIDEYNSQIVDKLKVSICNYQEAMPERV